MATARYIVEMDYVPETMEVDPYPLLASYIENAMVDLYPMYAVRVFALAPQSAQLAPQIIPQGEGS